MSFRRIGALALGCAFVAMSLPTGAGAASASKELARIKGTVGYRAQAAAPFQPVLGKLDLADDAWAVTESQSAALLRLADSSEVELGERTTVQVGAFNDAASGKQNVVVVDHGALHFKIRHPQGVRSNYTFQTGTSQIAVRGTEAVLVVGPKGTQLTCIECTPGDVTVTTGAQVMTIVTGQTLTILGSTPFSAAASVAQNVAVHNPAVDQFASVRGALGTHASSVAAVDPTGAIGAVQGSAAAAAGAGAAGVAAAAGGVAAVAAVAASHSGGSAPATAAPATAAPTASPTPVATPAPTATPSASPTATPVPTATPTASASPTASPTPVYGQIVLNPASGQLTVGSASPSGSFTVQQAGPNGTITLAVTSCDKDIAGMDVSPSTVAVGQPSPAQISFTAHGHGQSEPKGICTIGITGGGGATATMTITVTQHSGNDAVRRVPTGTAPRAPGSSAKPGSAPASPPQPAPAAFPGPGAAPGRPGPGISH